jgi:hypothetical protein
MSGRETETIREFVFAGSLSVEALIAIGIGSVVLVGFLAWWESRRSTNRWLFPVFVLLRLGAIAVVLWMLAEPSIRTRSRHATPKSLAILADKSASMGVVDSEGNPLTAVRWAAASNPSSRSRLLVEVDGAAAAAEIARHHLASFAGTLTGGGSHKLLKRSLAGARNSLETATRQLQEILPAVLAEGINPGAELGPIRSDLAGEILPRIIELENEIESGRILLTEDRTEQLYRTVRTLGTHSRRLRTLADELASEHTDRVDQATQHMMRTQSSMSRAEKVSGLLEEAERRWMEDVEQNAEVIRYSFDSGVYPIAEKKWDALLSDEAVETGLTTDLAAAIGRIALDRAGKSIEAAIFLTDGGHNAERDAVKVASMMPELPVYVVPVGETQPQRDIILHHVQSPRAVFLNDLIVIEAMVDAHGCADEQLVVELLRQDEVVDSVQFVLPSDTFARQLTFTHKADEMGMLTFRLRIPEIPGERVKENNKAELSVEVVEDTVRVFLVDFMPRWEFRYLRNLFRREERIEFEELLFEPRGLNAGTPAKGEGLPRDLDAWARYRVVILGDVPPNQLDDEQQELLEQYVSERGGTLILIAGEDAMPAAYAQDTLAKMMPVQLTRGPLIDDTLGFSLYVTPEGRSVPATQLADDALASDRIWSSMLPVYGVSEFSRPKPTSHVLIGVSPRSRRGQESGPQQAFLCWQYYGRGRVVYLSAPVTYRLRFRQGDLYHHRFWGQLVRWAVAREMARGSKTVKISTNKARYTQGDDVEVTARLNSLSGDGVSGADCLVMARQEGHLVAQVELDEDEEQPGVYHGVLKDLPLGSITLSAMGPEIQSLLAEEHHTDPIETEITVDPPETLELRNTQCNLALLSRIAESTGGMTIPPTALETVIKQLDLAPEISETVSQQAVWTRWVLLWIFLACLATEWAVRKLAGMA